MCGIFGYVNYLVVRNREEIIETLLDGLARLEYRGYDSAGLAFDSDDGDIVITKCPGRVAQVGEEVRKSLATSMQKEFASHCGLAHTRWATHGEPSVHNAHPQRSDELNEFVVVHNGIISNYKDIMRFLEKKGYVFESQTDTESIAKLAHYLYRQQVENGDTISLLNIAKAVMNKLDGSLAAGIKSKHFPGEAVFLCRGSPLMIGLKTDGKLKVDTLDVFAAGMDVGDGSGSGSFELRQAKSRAFLPENGAPTPIEYIFASDQAAIVEHTNKVVHMVDHDIAHVIEGGLQIHRARRTDGESLVRFVQTLSTELDQIMKGSFKHFMIKEIFEQPESIWNAMRGRINFKDLTINLGGVKPYLENLRGTGRIVFISSGSSYHSSVAVRLVFEELVGGSIATECSSDFLDRLPPIYRNDVCVFISQSGETADTILALKYCLKRGALCVGITNVVGSTISRITHCGVHVNAGPEISVASTKAYTSQCVVLIMLALVLGEDKTTTREKRKEILRSLEKLPQDISEVLEMNDQVQKIAVEVAKQRSILVVGRGHQNATRSEGALKIKEITYIHSEGILAGELKHGPIALVDEKEMVFLILPTDAHYQKTYNAYQQIVARGSRPIIITDRENKECFDGLTVFRVPKTIDCLQSITIAVLFQLVAYHTADHLDLDVDHPRNLAKSVTVE